MAGKLRQVQRFVEVLGHLLNDWNWNNSRVLEVADMGAGKGYLTFALAHAFKERGWDAHVVGVEVRAELVAKANQAARELGFTGLHFIEGSIGNWRPQGALDVLVALHACNTATDDALFQGIQAEAGVIVTSPCCHQEIRTQLHIESPLRPIAGHGILEERQAEIVTDALRAQLLQIRGYDARVFEFVEPEHSGKNLMLAGVRRKSGGPSADVLRDDLAAMWRAFGIRTQRLATLLEEEPK
jgi:SAM-dependent methyltransferase